jgi:hypothetical protein
LKAVHTRAFIAFALLVPLSAVFAAEPTRSPQSSSAASEGPAVNTSPGVPSNAKAEKSKPSSAAAAGAGGTAASSNSKSSNRSDRLNLETTVVTGNRELPKVLYIVPWKKAEIGDLPGQPFNTLLDEVLTPVDRDVFRREVTYYGAVSAGANAGNSAPTTSAPGTEK